MNKTSRPIILLAIAFTLIINTPNSNGSPEFQYKQFLYKPQTDYKIPYTRNPTSKHNSENIYNTDFTKISPIVEHILETSWDSGCRNLRGHWIYDVKNDLKPNGIEECHIQNFGHDNEFLGSAKFNRNTLSNFFQIDFSIAYAENHDSELSKLIDVLLKHNYVNVASRNSISGQLKTFIKKISPDGCTVNISSRGNDLRYFGMKCISSSNPI
ncbi:hypothetical protein [Novosphingobium sp.]|uniref:hypothetical protein n=1 Tax=Novosphingobium sp. TaxID=1874826 RepID=UPI003B516895